MRYLIDGFNLFFVMMPRRTGRDQPPDDQELDRFLQTLSGALRRCQTGRVTVVFDARQRPLWAPRREQRYGLHIINAIDAPEADDVIIQLIQQDSAPRHLVVVSSDRRIRDVARRRKAKVCTSQEFVRQLRSGAQTGGVDQELSEAEKPEGPFTKAEIDRYMNLYRQPDTGGMPPDETAGDRPSATADVSQRDSEEPDSAEESPSEKQPSRPTPYRTAGDPVEGVAPQVKTNPQPGSKKQHEAKPASGPKGKKAKKQKKKAKAKRTSKTKRKSKKKKKKEEQEEKEEPEKGAEEAPVLGYEDHAHVRDVGSCWARDE